MAQLKPSRIRASRPGPLAEAVRQVCDDGCMDERTPVKATGACNEDEELDPGEIERRELEQPLTDEEVAQALAAIEQARIHQAYLLEKYGKFDPPSWVLINEAREERMRQLG
jgi:hypothetical protein